MKAFKVFILGVLCGWLMKIALDRIYRDSASAAGAEPVRRREAKPQPKSSMRTAAPAKTVQPTTGNDNLKLIKGIGPAIEKKLNEAGIHTFAALARLTAEELENILGRTSRLADERDLITQAEKLAKQKEA